MVRKQWSKEEEKILLDNAHKSADELAQLLPKRSKHAIYHKRKSLGIRTTTKITEEDLEFIKANYQDMTAKEISDHIGATPDAVKYRLKSLGLSRLSDKWEIDNVEGKIVSGDFQVNIDFKMV